MFSAKKNPAITVPPPGRCPGPMEVRWGLQLSSVDSEPDCLWVPVGLGPGLEVGARPRGGAHLEAPNPSPLGLWIPGGLTHPPPGPPACHYPEDTKSLGLRSTVTWPLLVFQGAETAGVAMSLAHCPGAAPAQSRPQPPLLGKGSGALLGPLPPSPFSPPAVRLCPLPSLSGPRPDRHPTSPTAAVGSLLSSPQMLTPASSCCPSPQDPLGVPGPPSATARPPFNPRSCPSFPPCPAESSTPGGAPETGPLPSMKGPLVVLWPWFSGRSMLPVCGGHQPPPQGPAPGTWTELDQEHGTGRRQHPSLVSASRPHDGPTGSHAPARSPSLPTS